MIQEKSKQETTSETEDDLRRNGLVEWARRFLLGDDIFISYAREDATNYAPALANQLSARKFICYLDQYGTDINDEISLRLKLKLLRSTTLVLVGSKTAIGSTYVKKELALFQKTGRPIIPIDVDGALRQPGWYEMIRGLPISTDPQSVAAKEGVGALEDPQDVIAETMSNLRAAQPSPIVVSRIADTFSYTKRSQWQRILLIASVLFILISLGVAIRFLNSALDAENRARLAGLRAIIANVETTIAEDKTKEAESKFRRAQIDAREADDKRRVAEATAKLADDKAANAEAREKSAKEREAQATANARHQEFLASVINESSEATRLIADQPDTALNMSIATYEKAPTVPQAQFSLFSNLQHYGHLTRINRAYPGKVYKIASCYNGKVLAAAEYGDKVVFWDVAHNRLLGEPHDEHGKSLDLIGVACVADGSTCASWDYDDKTFIIWNIIDKGNTFEVQPVKRTASFSFSFGQPMVLINKDLMVTGGAWGEVALWDLSQQTPKPQYHKLLDHGGEVQTLAVSLDGKSLDGKSLAAGFWGSGTVAVWHPDKPDEPAVSLYFYGDPPSLDDGVIESLAFSSDGRYLAAEGNAVDTRRAVLWDLKNLKKTDKPTKSEENNKTTKSADSSSKPKDVQVCLDEYKTCLKDYNYPMAGVDFGGEHQVVLLDRGNALPMMLTASEDGEMVLWNIFDDGLMKREKTFSFAPGVESMALMACGTAYVATGSGDGTLAFWDMGDAPVLGKKMTVSDDDGFSLFDDYVSFEGDELFLAGPTHSDRRWFGICTGSSCKTTYRAGDQRLVGVKPGSFGWALEPQWDESSGNLKSVKITDQYSHETTKTVTNIENIKREKEPLMALSPDCKRLAIKQGDSIVILDIRDAKRPTSDGSLTFGNKTPSVFKFSLDNRLAAGYSDGDALLWDVESMKWITQYKSVSLVDPVSHRREGINSIALSDDNRLLATASKSSPICLWDRKTGQLLSRFMDEDNNSVSSLAFRKDGHKLAASEGFTVKVWDIDPQVWVGKARQIASNN